jgi:hypothetical protein
MNLFQNSRHPRCSTGELPVALGRSLTNREFRFMHLSSRGASNGYETASWGEAWRLVEGNHNSAAGPYTRRDPGNPARFYRKVSVPQRKSRERGSLGCRMQGRMLNC